MGIQFMEGLGTALRISISTADYRTMKRIQTGNLTPDAERNFYMILGWPGPLWEMYVEEFVELGLVP